MSNGSMFAGFNAGTQTRTIGVGNSSSLAIVILIAIAVIPTIGALNQALLWSELQDVTVHAIVTYSLSLILGFLVANKATNASSDIGFMQIAVLSSIAIYAALPLIFMLSTPRQTLLDWFRGQRELAAAQRFWAFGSVISRSWCQGFVRRFRG